MTSKPLDCGNGLLAASVDAAGGVQAIVVPDPDLGVLVVDTQPPFPDELRGDAEAVRAYRLGLCADDAPSIGLRPRGGWDEVGSGLAQDLVPRSRMRQGVVRAQVTSAAVPGRPAVVQRWRLVADSPVEAWPYRVAGPVHVTRAALTQLTEGGVLPMPPATARVAVDGDVLVLTSSLTSRGAALAGLPSAGWMTHEGEGPLEVGAEGTLDLPAGQVRHVQLVWAVGGTAGEAAALARELAATPAEELLPPPSGTQPGVRSRARSYVAGCCALEVGETVCLVTDHRILPLSWTRDAYWAARMLLDDREAELVRRHLLWLFEVAERPEVTWARAHLPNGAVKDPAFQLDQQCYPLLELAEYVLETGDLDTAGRLAPHVPPLLAALEERRDGATGLYPTAETPADDPLPLPFHCSSHILLWHTLERLGDLGVHPGPLRARAAELRHLVRARFTIGSGQDRRFAYAVGAAQGEHLDYHDANDLPTAFAPLWGFCTADDPVWRATMRFAFSAANDGWAEGAFGGLGSVHTPGAWPLGDVQEYVVARVTGEDGRAREVLRRLLATACADGALPEARDPRSGTVCSRHWFAWPGAALAVALAGCGEGEDFEWVR